MNRTHPDQQQSGGFTLLEMMIAMAIIGLTAGTATMEALRHRPDHNLNRAVSHIVSELRFARTTAISENVPTTFEYNHSTKEMTIAVDRNGNGTIATDEQRITDLSDIPGLRINNLVGAENGTFNEKGGLVANTWTAQFVAVQVEGAQNTKRCIVIYPTGQIEVTDRP